MEYQLDYYVYIILISIKMLQFIFSYVLEGFVVLIWNDQVVMSLQVDTNIINIICWTQHYWIIDI